MNKYRTTLEQLNISKPAEIKLSRILDGIASGNSEVFYTPFVKNKSQAEGILSGWDKIYQSKIDFIDNHLQEIEESNRSKYGPRSIAKPWEERKSSLEDYYNNIKDGIFDYPFNETNRLRPLSVKSAVEYLKNATNSGLPFMARKGKIKPIIGEQFNELLKRKDPCVLFTRTQEGNKTRDVWGFPIADTTNEMRFFRPVFEYQSGLSWRSAVVSPEAVDLGVTKLIQHAVANDLYLVSIDFSSYDASIPEYLIDFAFNYFKALFQRSYHDELDYIADRFKTIGIVTPDGVFTGSHGVPSGSTFTNEVDSVVQFGISTLFEEDLLYQQVQGDDGVYATSDPEALINHFKSYGLNVNEEKSSHSLEYCTFLQNYYNISNIKNGVIGGIYSTYRALNRIVHLERFNDFKTEISGKDYFAIRTISILENCKNHPLFEDLVKYVLSLDKYDLKFSDQGLKAYVKMRKRQAGKDVNFDFRYGDSLGIKSFETYKILSKLT